MQTTLCHHPHEEYCLKRVPIFNNLLEEEMKEISKILIHRTYKKGEMIYLSGEEIESLYIINKGKVKITKSSESGKEQIIRILSVGDFINELSVFTRTLSNNNVEAIEETTMCILSARDLQKIIEKNPGIAIKIMQELGERLEKTEKLIESIGLMSVEERIASAILEFSKGGSVVKLPISKKDLASYIGTSQESLSRKLTQFQNNGWIKQEGQRKIIILNRKALEEIR